MDPTQLNFKEVFGLSSLKHTWFTVKDQGVLKMLAAMVMALNDWFFHPRHELVTIVLVLILFDTITGYLKAYKRDEVSSSGFFRFALKLLVYMILLGTGALLDKLTESGLPIHALSITASFLAITEAISILENISSLGFAVPGWLLNVLKKSK